MMVSRSRIFPPISSLGWPSMDQSQRLPRKEAETLVSAPRALSELVLSFTGANLGSGPNRRDRPGHGHNSEGIRARTSRAHIPGRSRNRTPAGQSQLPGDNMARHNRARNNTRAQALGKQARAHKQGRVDRLLSPAKVAGVIRTRN